MWTDKHAFAGKFGHPVQSQEVTLQDTLQQFDGQQVQFSLEIEYIYSWQSKQQDSAVLALALMFALPAVDACVLSEGRCKRRDSPGQELGVMAILSDMRQLAMTCSVYQCKLLSAECRYA